MPPELLAYGREVLAKQPFSVLLEAQLDLFEPGRAQMSLPMSAELLQQDGFVHGGVMSYLADNALTCAGDSVRRRAQIMRSRAGEHTQEGSLNADGDLRFRLLTRPARILYPETPIAPDDVDHIEKLIGGTASDCLTPQSQDFNTSGCRALRARGVLYAPDCPRR